MGQFIFAKKNGKDLVGVQHKKSAFTFAEVLITLGIIGVVAAMTLPTLIQNYKAKVIANKVKKFYSMLSQAIVMSEVDNGPSVDWEKSKMVFNADKTENIVENNQLTVAYFNKYLKPYIKYVKIDENPKDWFSDEKELNNIKVYLADGAVVRFRNGDCMDLIYDVNGDKIPNEFGRDWFNFLICSEKYINIYGGNKNPTTNYYLPYFSLETREDILETCQKQPESCAMLLMHDGWEFKSDYPYKL